jgi:plasmid stability protein
MAREYVQSVRLDRETIAKLKIRAEEHDSTVSRQINGILKRAVAS